MGLAPEFDEKERIVFEAWIQEKLELMIAIPEMLDGLFLASKALGTLNSKGEERAIAQDKIIKLLMKLSYKWPE